MKTRVFFTVMTCILFLFSCRDTENTNDQDYLNTEENEFSRDDRNIPSDGVDEDNFEDKNDNAVINRENKASASTSQTDQRDSNEANRTTALTGQFIKIGNENDFNCNCYCLDLSSSTAELCLVEGKMYVNTRMQKNSNNSIDIFLVEPAARNTEGKEMPWKDFDRNIAIATIKPKSNGEIELDWLGFKINGDIAVDYAIFGKKTLEGDYKKK